MCRRKQQCTKCGKEISLSNYQRHIDSCKSSNEKLIKINEEWKQENGLYKCPHCNKEYSKKGIATHIFRNHTDEGKNFNPNKGYKDKTIKRIAWNKGTITPNETREKISKANKGKKYTEEQKLYLSSILKGKNGGYRKGSGRGKHGRYKGYWCDSSYELAFVIYNLEHNIPFIRNTQGFEYKFNNGIHKYYPDFIMEDGTYIEIKGYETDKDLEKQSQFKYKLKVLKPKDLKYIFDYVIDKYGKDFIKLYE